jgi:hypothetical protein
MLSTCHDRIKLQCATLGRLVLHLPVHGVNGEVRTAATNLVRFCSISATSHHADEGPLSRVDRIDCRVRRGVPEGHDRRVERGSPCTLSGAASRKGSSQEGGNALRAKAAVPKRWMVLVAEPNSVVGWNPPSVDPSPHENRKPLVSR